MAHFMIIFLSAILVNNFVLSRFLGMCSFLGVSKRSETALGMGMAVTFVMTLSAVLTWIVQKWILVPYNITYLQTTTFIMIIAVLVQLVEVVLQKTSPGLYQALGIYLPLITTNCAVLGATLININDGYGLMESTINTLGAALGYTMAIVVFATLRERLELAPIPECLKGFPIALITASLFAMAFLGFSGFRLDNLFGM